MSKICDNAKSCNGCCVISQPHVCKDCHPEDGGPTFCFIAERYVRCIPNRNYDAEGRAARRYAVRLARIASRHIRTISPEREISITYARGVRETAMAILAVMRDARKGEK